MEISKLYDSYRNIVLENSETSIKDYNNILKKIEESPAQYKGKAVEFLYQPVFLSEKDYQYFETIVDQLVKILNKVTNKYIEDEKFRSYFGFSPLLEKLILKDPGYSINAPMARFDIFYNLDGSFQFCELNADGTSGMVEVRELQKVIGESFVMNKLKETYSFKDFELLDSWAQALFKNYKEFSNSDDKPQIAIIDFFEGKPRGEFTEFQKTFEKFGCKTIVVNPKDLVYRENKLYYGDFRIDCIYRRSVTWEIIENQDEVMDLINAYLDGNVCLVGPLRSQLMHNKLIFAILHDERKTSFLTKEEREFVKKYIPYTAVFDIDNEDLVEYTIDKKEDLVLKPMDKYASTGVCIGTDFEESEWEKVVKKEDKEEYILQQFCQVPKIPMPMIRDKSIEFIDSNYLLGLFVYNEKLQGLYTRTSTTNVIGAETGSYTVPTFIVEEKTN